MEFEGTKTNSQFMIRKTLSLALTAAMTASVANAQVGKQSPMSQDCYVAANQCFNIEIFEAPDSLLIFDNPQQERGAEARGNNRGVFGGLLKTLRQSYQSTLVGQIATTSGDILSSGIGLISELVGQSQNTVAKGRLNSIAMRTREKACRGRKGCRKRPGTGF